MDKMIENQPPVKKLKQATLSFFKAAPVKEMGKVQPNVQSKKRRNSNSLESPSGGTKINKALAPILVIESPNSKASKKRKVSHISDEDKTNEVSSSSEADSASGKHTNGRCCLLDRFVRVLPADVHQEISSTNEVLDVSVEFETDQPEKTLEPEDVPDKLLDTAKVGEDKIIIIDDNSSDSFSKPIADDTHSKVTPSDVVPAMPFSTPAMSDTCQTENEKLLSKTFSLSQINSEENKFTVDASDVNNSTLVDTSVCSENNVSQEAGASVPSEENCTDFDGNISHSSDIASSTPLKSMGKNSSVKAKKRTPKTPSSENSSKKRKSLEKESEKKKKKEERERERMEKKKKIEEEKAEKERLKQEKKLMKEAKEKEKQEHKEKLEKERMEKEKAKEEERKKKEEEKMKKEEEKRKKQLAVEAKLEEKRRKEEEKVKEEEEKKKKEEKTKQVFQKFFIKPKDTPVKQTPTSGMFIPFQVKKDMHLAPIVRRDALSEDKKNTLDLILSSPQNSEKTYLQQLKSGDTKPHRTGRILRHNPKPVADVEVIHDSEILKTVTHQVKLLQFHTDYRPPYYGTWRKQPKISPRNPWKKDESVFDYEVDSDDEWEEEEPGESLSCSDGEEEKGEEVEEEEDDGWMVPHGYLSEGEGCSEDDEITPEKLKRQQLAKAKAWEEEQNRKLQVAPLITVGCFFQHSPSVTMSGDVRLLYEFRAVVLATSTPIPTCLYGSSELEKEELTPLKSPAATTPKGPRKKSVPDEAMPDLIRLVHGNVSGIKRLIREFRIYWFKQLNPTSTVTLSPEKVDKLNVTLGDINDSVNINESLNEAVPCESEEKQKSGGDVINDDGISKRQLELTIASIAVREKRDCFPKNCWYVHEHILKQYNMTDIHLPNSWVYLTAPPKIKGTPNSKSQGTPNNKSHETPKSKTKVTPKLKSHRTPKSKVLETPKSDTNAEVLNESDKTEKEVVLKQPPKDQRSIKDFALSKEELSKKICQPAKSEISKEEISKVNQPQQSTPKDLKKNSNQRSIMEFAKKPKCSEKIAESTDSKLKMKCAVLLDNHLKLNMLATAADTQPSTEGSSSVESMETEECLPVPTSTVKPISSKESEMATGTSNAVDQEKRDYILVE
ncbi:chromatin assembly factor 1 subunit A-like [Biomphalaria glabrata]|uniref:Chromatin assembly factor 1 subunit A-like n=1 Tax=Biomphalaria glabrata TaxID=6526 RepID=A0A9W2Z1H5_BIOGL|nr:chromatin assembly factor 1 subunit A-like [Biomphalaria glabrata]